MENTYSSHLFHANTSFLLACLFLFLLPFSSLSASDGVIVNPADYRALRAFKHELVDSRGFLRTWNDTGGYGVCSGAWAGIKCVNGRVIYIQLPWRRLGGRISEKDGQLKALKKLSLHENVLAGPLPRSLGFRPYLRGVYLFNNLLSGSIPPTIGNCHSLQTLDLSNNSLTGNIPPSLVNSTRLFRLNLSYNSLFGSIPVGLTRLPSLTILALQHNNLSGSVPDTWVGTGTKPYQLQVLSLDYNFLTGTIPVSLSELSLLQQVL
ncbi:putative leucine-rich repeat receptor-like protein kinase IMK3 [Hibiscus syriacus]|uniref:Leucine-rich repeat receptor-like protein kinase IMK3 n=1 Tax=Hibiscus syriacus TaxID=106335 RepID=A0A6A3A083_HIBSY|nr:putative leucine-rich repeat receptor-like protein kinase IMK3 [Hibiscus syriacus]